MPIYEYACCECSARFELLIRHGRPANCPDCGSASLEKLHSTAVVLSGQTARPAGRTCPGEEERGDMPPCSTGDVCRHE